MVAVVVALAEVADLAEEVAVEVEVVAVVVVAALEEVDHMVWEDCSRPECRS